MRKIKTLEDLEKLTRSSASVAEGVIGSGFSSSNLLMIKVEDMRTFFENPRESKKYTDLLLSSKFVLFNGPYGSGKRNLALQSIDLVYRDISVFYYDYREMRDRTRVHGEFHPEAARAQARMALERGHLAYAEFVLGAGGRVLVSDPMASRSRREALLRGANVGLGTARKNTVVCLISKRETMLEINEEENCYVSINTTYDDYLDNYKMLFPYFVEGWDNIIIINETTTGKKDYVSCIELMEGYREKYGEQNVNYFYETLDFGGYRRKRDKDWR